MLATKSATLERVLIETNAHAYRRNNLRFDDDGQPARATEPQLTFDILDDHHLWGPAVVAALPPTRLDVPHFAFTLWRADNHTVWKLLGLLDAHVTRVKCLKISGHRREPGALLPPMGRSEPAVNMHDFLINWRRNVAVKFLYCEFLSSELRLISFALHKPSLTDLHLRHCTRMSDLLWGVVRDAPNLRAFGYYGLLHTDNALQLRRGPLKENYQQLERWDLLGVLDFVRQVQAPLEVLDLEGAFSDTNLVSYGEHLFAAVQAHLPTLRQLFVLDGPPERVQAHGSGRDCPL